MSAADADRMRNLAAGAGPLIAAEPEERSELAVHHDELTEAVRWFIATGDVAAVVDMVTDLQRYWTEGGHEALARDLFSTALAMNTAPQAYVTSRQ